MSKTLNIKTDNCPQNHPCPAVKVCPVGALSQTDYNAPVIDRAKCTLVEYLRISEADAHRQIQKRAMDMRLPLAAVAKDILKTYEM